MITAPEKETEKDEELVHMKASDVSTLVEAIEAFEAGFKAVKAEQIHQTQLHEAIQAARLELDHVRLEPHSTRFGLGKAATILSGSATFGLAAAALAPMAVTAPLIAAGVGALVGWAAMNKADRDAEKTTD